MGVFSWKTQDTNRSIASKHNTGHRPTFKVIMTDDKGNQWVEEKYEGYGEFGGKDFYELVAEMNGKGSDREVGINIEFGDDRKKYIFPSLTENGKYYDGVGPENCEYQGYFYDDDEEDDW